MAFSAGGAGELAAQVGNGEHSLGFEWIEPLPEPVLDGSVATT